MSPIEILKYFNLCYLKIETIAQDKDWQKLISEKKLGPEATTYLGDALHYLSEVMGCVEPLVDPDEINKLNHTIALFP
ncbi:MAG: hypothetical protein HWQ43_13180 [Nostoc sp. JL31]|uniref:hypothetical protein n=1 Tax=Nostoc sp. JL31 TaxID=2815395 RepID=UPI0025FB7CB2|nr:hypothetical protein [Nostoc sp. JL31]MBN3890075.1 hypothetical protein [Nostoc sp. JL31]